MVPHIYNIVIDLRYSDRERHDEKSHSILATFVINNRVITACPLSLSFISFKWEGSVLAGTE